MTRKVLRICWNVQFVVYNMLVAPARCLGLGLMIKRRAVVNKFRSLSAPGGIYHMFY